MRDTQVQSLSWEDPLEKEIAPHSSTLSWKIPWTEEPGRLQSMGVTKSRTRLSDFTSRISCTFHPHWTPHSQNILSSFVTPFLLYVASFASCYFTLSTLHALPSRNLHKCWFFSVPIYYIHSTNTVHLTVNSRVCFVTYIYPQWLH